ncbi:MAG: SpoIID/LytB domain-containing protein [Bacteroidales bacterium]|nr:SpoIID/LytB domain-containing protein [Bacteroidales bacterium]MDD6141515.1 SpoIID/LytB domain-containing protein [Bacteroidales bacterium]
MQQPNVKVGIMSGTSISFAFAKDYTLDGKTVTGSHTAKLVDGEIEWNGNRYPSLEFVPVCVADSHFTLIDVTIGVNFHWERKENQSFRGSLRLIVEGDKLTAVNILPIEEYLLSVISSEMSATASLELLKAHAVISRSWLLAQIDKNKQLTETATAYCPCTRTDDELVRWFDREDHVNFDVCADDHCQRYQGITRESTETVRQAIEATWGEVLMDGDKLCDARFSKSCGGVFEEFENCWEPVHHNYLQARHDGENPADFPDLTVEENAREWILNAPDAFCNTHDARILSQVLNSYDQETTDFYRWKVEYSQEELARLVSERSGEDYGEIIDLIPVARGTSGRIYRLKIVGTHKTQIIGKELEIRRTLSPSHLYSSAFVVEKVGNGEIPDRFIIRGAGWGHGVGLCQIGAAVMGEKGYNYNQILEHYFVGAKVTKLYQ